MERSSTRRNVCPPLVSTLVLASFVSAASSACTNTSNDPAPDERRSTQVDAGFPDAMKAGPGYLWFAGSQLNAFTQDQTQSSNDAGPSIIVEPSEMTGTFHDLVFDPSGNLWTVPITGDQIVRVPRVGLTNIRPFSDLTLSSPALKSPQTLAFDSAGNLWVVNYNGSGPNVANIVRFDGVRDMPSGNPILVPSLTIGAGSDKAMIAAFTQGSALAFDKDGNLWFGGISSVMRFDSPSSLHGSVDAAPAASISTGDSYASIAFDSVGSLWITATSSGYYALRVANPGMLTGTAPAQPAARISLPGANALFAGGMAFDADGALWIAMSDQIIKLSSPSSMVGNVTPGPEVVLSLPSKSYPDLASKLAFWPSPSGLPVF